MPDEFLGLLKGNDVTVVADVRLRPDRSSMGAYIKAKMPDRGIEGLLTRARIRYFSFVELGNVFLDLEDWKTRYETLINRAGDLFTERLLRIPPPFCLMCAEKSAERCHRVIIAAHLAERGYEVEHIE